MIGQVSIGDGLGETIRQGVAAGDSRSGPTPSPPGRSGSRRAATAGRKILLVEDNPGDVVLVRKMLASRGMEIEVALDLASGARRLADSTYDAIVLDLSLPDGRDLATVRRIVPAAPTTPIVVLTAQEDERMADRCLEHGVDDYVHKGEATADALARAIEYAVTRRKATEIARRLEIAERHGALGRIAASVAHEINNHAAVLLANNELTTRRLDSLASGGGETIANEVAAMMRAAGDDRRTIVQIAEIVAELNEFARKDELPPGPVDTAETIRRTVRMMGQRLGAAVSPRLELDPCPPVYAHEGKLVQVLINLTKNAIEAIEDARPLSPHLGIRLANAGEWVEITVEDNGIGIPASARERLFVPYFTSKPRGRGTGLGLAVCAEIVHAWGGTIDVDSQEGSGSRFLVRLRVFEGERHDEAAGSRPGTQARGRPGLRRRRVLIIDDEATLAHLLARVLAPFHEVIPVVGGRAAIDYLARDAEFDAILCDLMMPDVDGVAVCEHLQRNHPALYRRTAILSGGAFTDRTTRFIENAGRPILTKPVMSERVLELVETLANDD